MSEISKNNFINGLIFMSGVTRYLEFKSIEGSYVMGKSGKISKVKSNFYFTSVVKW